MRKDKTGAPIFAKELLLKYRCPQTEKVVEVDISNQYVYISGGCHGQHTLDEYCYCDPAEPLIEVECPSCSGFHPFTFN